MYWLVLVVVVVAVGSWVEAWVGVVVVKGAATGGALVEAAIVVAAGLLVVLVVGRILAVDGAEKRGRVARCSAGAVLDEGFNVPA